MILGIDEVGRGPWAGPLVIGAVALENPQDNIWQELDDSKKLTAKKREELKSLIQKEAKISGLGWVSAAELDAVGLKEALKLATMRAICKALSLENPKSVNDFNETVSKVKSLPFAEIIIDGTVNFLERTPLEDLVTVLPKADSKIKAVSAASIIAKVERDNYMKNLAKKYPEYGFEKHVGYGTKMHKEALTKYGPCEEHRKSFRPVAQALGLEEPHKKRNQENSTSIGRKAEDIVSEYLKTKGHTVIARNHKTKYYEIDIVSATKNHIYFTEVKYRKNSSHGTPLDFIDAKKKKQIVFAANSFMKYLSTKLGRDLDSMPSPKLAAAAVSGLNFHLDQWVEIK